MCAPPDDLWDLVASGGDAIGEFPIDRGWDLERLFDIDPTVPEPAMCVKGDSLRDATEFDAEFFGISPREAITMDPQQRLLLEASWEAFENARLNPTTLAGTPTGVFAGISSIDYGPDIRTTPQGSEGYMGPVYPAAWSQDASHTYSDWRGQRSRSTPHAPHPSSPFTGPASPYAQRVHARTRQRLHRPRRPRYSSSSRQRGVLAPDGRCRAFADSAMVLVWSEGVGVLLLERLSDALRNGRPVLGIVRGSAINQDGASNGLTAPNGPSQERVIRQALVNAGLSVGDVDVVEAHGTGTTLGDPI